MEEITCNIAVIGAGPAGQKAAIQCAKLGKQVVVIEKKVDPGGNCLFTGTIPSKSLREAIIDLTRFYQHNYYAREYKLGDVTINDLMSRLNHVIEEERNMVARQLKKNSIRQVNGLAYFEGPHQLHVEDPDTKVAYRVVADRFIICTGSKPRTPVEVPFDNDTILNSTTLLTLDRVPRTMLVLGGGIIGSEYASWFSALGTEVTIIDRKDHILPMLDSEIGIHLQTALMDLGLRFIGNTEPKEIKRVGDHAYVKCNDGSEHTAEVLLFALGRTANIDSLRVEKAGIAVDNKGYMIVNDLFQTSVPHIYAAGDVIGGPSLASTSMEQGRLAGRHACGEEAHRFPDFYPIGIYAIPEISSCGYTEDELKRLGFRYEVGRAYYYEIARSHITGSSRGMFKIIFHAETLEILGVHVIGRGATEVIHIGQVAISFNAKLDYFIDQVFNYPTYAEGYRVAALNGINKIKHRR